MKERKATSENREDMSGANTLASKVPASSRVLKTLSGNVDIPSNMSKLKKHEKFVIYEDSKQPTENAGAMKDIAVQTADYNETTNKKESDVNNKVDYWKKLALTKQKMLENALVSNEDLKEKLRTLEEENALLKEVVQKAEDVMEAVKEWSS